MDTQPFDNVFVGTNAALGLTNQSISEEEQDNDVDVEWPTSDEEEGDFPLVEVDSDSSGGEEKDIEARTRIRPSGNSFCNPNIVLSEAHSIIQSLFTGAWISWRKVPSEKKEIWFEEFKKKFFWKDKHSQAVRRNWRGKCSEFLRTTFCTARGNKRKPAWICQTIWNDMLELWDSEDFKKLSTSNKSHRACLKGGFTGGARNTQQHVLAYEKKFNKKMTQGKLMRKLYRKGKTKKWTGIKPQILVERFNELRKAFNEEHPEGMTKEDICRLWVEAGGINSKGQMYGQGSMRKAPNYRNPGTISSQVMSTNVDGNQLGELRKSMEEDLRRSITEEVQRATDAKIQQLLAHNRQQEARHIQVQRAQQMQIQRLVQSIQQVPFVDPLQTDISFTGLLNSSPNQLLQADSSFMGLLSSNPPLTSPIALVDTLMNGREPFDSMHQPPSNEQS